MKARTLLAAAIASMMTMTSMAQKTPVISYTFENGQAADDEGKYMGSLTGSAQITEMSDGNHALFTGDGYFDMTADMGKDILNGLTSKYTISLDFCISGENNTLSSFCWLYGLAVSTSAYIGMVNTPTNSNWYYEIKNGTTYNNKSGTGVSTDEWHNITVTQRLSSNVLYIDGKKVSTATISSSSIKPSHIASSLQLCALGKSPFSGDALMRNTFMDNFKIFDDALTADEVDSLYTITKSMSAKNDEVTISKTIYSWQQTGNPIITHKYTCDPAAMVKGDTLYIFSGQDYAGGQSGYNIQNWCCFATTDMKNFWEYDIPLRASDISWCNNYNAYAGHVIERNGKYYWYFSTNTTGIGVAVADSPEGPYKDALGYALLTNANCSGASHSWRCIDPAVFIDDDGQAWLYWGNGGLWCCKLNEDMISYDSSYGVKKLSITGNQDFSYTEAPWMHKRNGIYYMSYASGFPERISYAISKKPDGPFTYKGIINEIAGNSNTNHQAIVEFKGQWYFIYHNGGIQTDGGSYSRSVCIDTLGYNDDGTIIPIKMTTKSVDMIEKPDITAIKEIAGEASSCPFEMSPNGNAITMKDGTSAYMIVDTEGRNLINGYATIVDISLLKRGIYIISNGKESWKFHKK